ncbi:MAG: carotenoid 1,2-hydratase, partial [Pseudomonadota bacterium]
MSVRVVCWALLLTLASCAPDPDRGEVATPLQQTLGGDPDPGFERALHPRPIRLPQDHGAHPDFRTEWWYFTGHLKADAR